MLSFFRRKNKAEATATEPAQNEAHAEHETIETEYPAQGGRTGDSEQSEEKTEIENIENVATPDSSNADKKEEASQTEADIEDNQVQSKDTITPSPAPEVAAKVIEESAPSSEPEKAAEEPPKKTGFFARLKQSLSKTRRGFTESLANLFLGKKEIDDDLLDELEMILLTADIGIETTDRIIQTLTDQVSRKELKDPEALFESLKIQLREILHPVEQPLDISQKPEGEPFVILVVGVNGAGKTTTIGKLANKFKKEGKSVMLAAGDTFRAAAVEQLQTWGERNDVPVIAQKTGADSAAVIFDAVQSAKARGVDVVIADTAGRLHTQSNLMEELKKVKRTITKVLPSAPHEVLLVLDSGTGQNALSQAKLFNEAVTLTGLALTKLDGTAKGGVIFALANQLQTPVRFIGVGEGIEDLRPFQTNEFIEALFE